jgi:hypothetical protein
MASQVSQRRQAPPTIAEHQRQVKKRHRTVTKDKTTVRLSLMAPRGLFTACLLFEPCRHLFSCHPRSVRSQPRGRISSRSYESVTPCSAFLTPCESSCFEGGKSDPKWPRAPPTAYDPAWAISRAGRRQAGHRGPSCSPFAFSWQER